MKKILWKDIKEEVAGRYLPAEDLYDKDTGLCTVDIQEGKWAGWSVAGKVIKDKDCGWESLEIEDNAVVYNPEV